MPAVMVFGFAALAGLLFAIFLPGIAADLAGVETSLSELVQSVVTSPDSKTIYLRSLMNYLKPWRTIRVVWLYNPLIFLLPLALLATYWAGAARLGRGSRRALWLASLPALFGLALFPHHLKGFANGYVALHDQGLTHSGGVAHGLGQASSSPVLGALISVICIFLMTWSQSRWSNTSV